MGTGFLRKKKEAREMQEQFTKMRAEIEQSEAIGTSAQGLVTVTLSGDYKVKSLKIKPECLDPDDIAGLESLIKAAMNDACAKLEAQSSKTMPGFPGF